jgi:hypothetical protein
MMIRPLFSNSRPHALLHRVHSSAHLHSNDHGPGQGFFGSLREKYAAEEAFEEGQAALLRVVGLGISGKGDWNALFESGAIYEIDPSYLRRYGFTQVGGGPFTLDEGLRPHLAMYVKRLAEDYENAYRCLPEAKKRVLRRVCEKHPSSDATITTTSGGDKKKKLKRVSVVGAKKWALRQAMHDPRSILELYDKAVGDAGALWDIQIAVAKTVGIHAPHHGDRCSAACWNIKPLSMRIAAKVTKYGGRLDQITDILRGSMIFDRPEQLSEAMDYLMSGGPFFDDFDDDSSATAGAESGQWRRRRRRKGRNDSVVWVNNRLSTGDAVHGYRDVLLLLSIDGHICELQLHLRALHEVMKNGHAAYAIAQLLLEDESDAGGSKKKKKKEHGVGGAGQQQETVMEGDEGGEEADITYDGERNDAGEYHGSGRLWVGVELYYEGDFAEGRMHGEGSLTMTNGKGGQYRGSFRDGKFHGDGTQQWPDGSAYEGEWRNNKVSG